MKRHYAYQITWVDSTAASGWLPMDSEQHACAVITSLGWLVKETKRDVTITTSITDKGYVTDALCIPRVAITRMRKLKFYVEGSE